MSWGKLVLLFLGKREGWAGDWAGNVERDLELGVRDYAISVRSSRNTIYAY